MDRLVVFLVMVISCAALLSAHPDKLRNQQTQENRPGNVPAKDGTHKNAKYVNDNNSVKNGNPGKKEKSSPTGDSNPPAPKSRSPVSTEAQKTNSKLHAEQYRQWNKAAPPQGSRSRQQGNMLDDMGNIITLGGNGLPIGLPIVGTIESPIGLGFINLGNNVTCRPDFRRPYLNFSNPYTPLVIPLLAPNVECTNYPPYIYCAYQLSPSPGFYCSN